MVQSPRSPAYSNDNDGGEGVCVPWCVSMCMYVCVCMGGFVNVCVCVWGLNIGPHVWIDNLISMEAGFCSSIHPGSETSAAQHADAVTTRPGTRLACHSGLMLRYFIASLALCVCVFYSPPLAIHGQTRISGLHTDRPNTYRTGGGNLKSGGEWLR
jgi:hypothetical protein